MPICVLQFPFFARNDWMHEHRNKLQGNLSDQFLVFCLFAFTRPGVSFHKLDFLLAPLMSMKEKRRLNSSRKLNHINKNYQRCRAKIQQKSGYLVLCVTIRLLSLMFLLNPYLDFTPLQTVELLTDEFVSMRLIYHAEPCSTKSSKGRRYKRIPDYFNSCYVWWAVWIRNRKWTAALLIISTAI